jgi:Fe/S biogenesis protein NfuA
MILVPAEEAATDDARVRVGTVTLLVDPESARNLAGTTIDFVSGDQSGFKFENPKRNRQWDDPAAERLQDLFETEISPGLAGHGGYVDLLDYRDGVAYVEMGGGCQGCGMASVTLREGIEVRVQQALPEVRRIVDATDHASGANPYYRTTDGSPGPGEDR